MKLHKIEIARRQIEVAAELFFADRDFLAVVTLSGAAEEILGNLIKRAGESAMIDRLVDLDKKLTGGRPFSDVNNEVNKIRNALKHANDPKEDEIEIEANEAISMLSRALANYVKLTHEQLSPNMVRVYEHLQELHPNVKDNSSSG